MTTYITNVLFHNFLVEVIVCMEEGYFFFLLNSPTTNRMTQAPTTAHTSCAHQEVPSVAPKSVYTQPPTTPPDVYKRQESKWLALPITLKKALQQLTTHIETSK